MQLIRYDPFRELQRMQRDLDKFWGGGWGKPMSTDSYAMDMYEEDGKLVAEVNLPSFRKEEVKVTADNGVLEVTAEHQEKEEKKNKRRYYLRESSDQYSRRIMLPEGADASNVEAAFKNGVLKIMMPMAEKPSTKHVEIK